MIVRKKLLGIILVLAFILIQTGMNANGEDVEKGKEKVEVRLVWKRAYADKLIPDRKTFPPPEIQREINSEEITEEGIKFLINTLRVRVAIHDRLVFFEGGKVMDVKAEGYLKVYFSPNGEYIGFGGGKKGMTEDELRKVRGYPREAYPLTQFVLMTKKGEYMWRKTIVPKLIRILNNGEVTEGVIPLSYGFWLGTLYGKKGETLIDFEKHLPVLQADPKEIPLFAHYSKLSDPPTLWLIADGGKVVLKKQLEDFEVGSAVLSDHGRYVLLNGVYRDSNKPWLMKQQLLSRNGNLIGEYSFWDPTTIDFSSDGDFIAIINNKSSLNFIESSTGRVLWQNPKESKDNNLWSVQVSGNGEFVLLSGTLATDGEGRKGKGSEVLLNKKGEILWRERLGLAEVAIARDGSYFLIEAPDSLYCYSINQ
jgi:hypothetical protein